MRRTTLRRTTLRLTEIEMIRACIIVFLSCLLLFDVGETLSVKNRRPKALYCSGAGVYFFWQVGAAKYLQEACAWEDMPIIGASAGSLTGLLLLGGVNFDMAVDVALRQAEERKVWTKKSGLRGELSSLLSDWMEEVLPRELSQETLGQLSIALTPPPVNPLKVEPPILESGFVSREDVIAACLASCHIPFFSSGSMTASYRGKEFIDGSFFYWVTKNRFSGLPLPECDPDDVMWIDYCDDQIFMEKIKNKSFLDVHDPVAVREMVDAGYEYLKLAHYEDRLPLTITPKPTNMPRTSVLRTTPSKLEKEIREFKKKKGLLEEEESGREALNEVAPAMSMHQAGLSGSMQDFTMWMPSPPTPLE